MSNKPQPIMGSVRKWTILREKYQLGDSNNYESVQVAAGLAIGRNEKVEVLEAAPTLQLIDKLAEALEHYEDIPYIKVDGVDSMGDEIENEYYVAEEAITELRKWKEGLK